MDKDEQIALLHFVVGALSHCDSDDEEERSAAIHRCQQTIIALRDTIPTDSELAQAYSQGYQDGRRG